MRIYSQITPIKAITESVKTKHESAKPGAKPTRTIGCIGEARTRAPNRPRHATGDAGPVEGPGSATEAWRESPTSRARKILITRRLGAGPQRGAEPQGLVG